jgi:carotenoid 1,2-hydratase
MADPQGHNAVNVALYGEGGQRWAMTERGRRDLHRDAHSLQIGPSRLRREQGGDLHIEVDEVTAPWPSHLRGRIDVRIDNCTQLDIALDAAGRHRWSPIAPHARIEVVFEQPRLRWRGTAYLDSNRGSAPLEADFARWHWSRAALPDGRSVVLYDVERRGGCDPLSVAFCFGADGRAEPLAIPPDAPLPRTGWRIDRATRCDVPAHARVLRTLEDGPFYARSLLEARLLGQNVRAVHESLSLDRFASPWVQAMLPFRMPRRG